MARRARGESHEAAFGSDSFLDVIANIVGILIILIVLVGLRVKYSPPSSDALQSADLQAEAAMKRWEDEKARIEDENKRARDEHQAAIARAKVEEDKQLALLEANRLEQARIDRRRDLHLAELARREAILKSYEHQAARLQAELDQLEGEFAAAKEEQEARQRAAREKSASIVRQLSTSEERAAAVRGELDQASTLYTSTTREGEELRERIARLAKEIAELDKTRPPKRIYHYGTPLARKVERHELHFRCMNGRLAYTNLDELLEATKEQARARITPSTSKLDGVAGPIGGFRLKYTLARPPLSVAEQLAELQLVRFSLVYWELQADSDPVGESVSDVLAPNSAFRVKLRSSPATEHGVTLWVYPDSFRLAKELETFLHNQGYVVALRPLPSGIPIIGSPLGTATHSH